MARRLENGRREKTGVTTALIYTRVSSDEQAREGLSLATQLEACEQYAARKGWIFSERQYTDVMTGKRDDRPQYQQLLIEARRLAGEGKSVAVVVSRLDRFGRRLIERLRSREEFKELGVATHSVNEGGEVSDLVANILGAVAQEEVTRLGARIADVRQHNIQHGWHVPGRAPWGYKWRAATAGERADGAHKAVLEVDEVIAPYIREAFRMVAQDGKTVRAVAVWMAGLSDEARGLIGKPTVDDEGTVVKASRVRSMNPSNAEKLLRMPVYIGHFEGDDGQISGQGRWPALIDHQTWDAVQQRLQAAFRGRSGPVSGAHVLTGLMTCELCGSKMGGWTIRPGTRRYRCSSFRRGGEFTARDCKGTAMAEPVEQVALDTVTALLAPLASTDPVLKKELSQAWERLRRPDDADTKSRSRVVAQAKRDIDDARRRIGAAARLLVDGTLDREGYTALSSAEVRRLEAAESILAVSQIERAVPDLPPLTDVLRMVGGWQAVLQTGPVPERAALLRVLVETVTPIRVSRGIYDAKIVWTPIGDALRLAARAAA